VRTGLPFDYVLNLSAQSQAWCSLGSTVGKLAPLGLGDARALAKLSERVESTPTDDEAQAILESDQEYSRRTLYAVPTSACELDCMFAEI
jgi:hypothetical protein